MQDISAEAVQQYLTAIRGKLRRSPSGVRKEQLALLSSQINENVPTDFIQRQTELMKRPLASDLAVGTLGWVYFLIADDTVKIGFSTDVSKRINSIRSETKKELKLLGTVRGTRGLEQRFHKKFADQALGGEWFRLNGEMVREIKLVLANAKRRN